MKRTTILSYLLTLLFFNSYSQEITGTWSSTFGELKLMQVGNTIVGDYAERGVIEGKLDNNTIVGRFTNKQKEGGFAWEINGDQFNGKWWWEVTPNIKGNWTGKKINTNRPSLKNKDETNQSEAHQRNGIVLPANSTKPTLNLPKDSKKGIVLPTTAGVPSVSTVTETQQSSNSPTKKPKEEKAKFVKKPNWVKSVHASNSQKVQNVANGSSDNVSMGNEMPKNPIVSRDKSIYCEVKEVPYTAQFNKLYLVAPSMDLQPGALLDPRFYESGDIVPIIPNQREPITLVSRDGGGWSKKATVAKINADTQQEVGQLLNQSPIPITSNYEITQVYSQNDLKLALGMSKQQEGAIVGKLGKINSETEFRAGLEKKKSKNYYLLKYQETLQTVGVNTPPKINGEYYFTNDPLPSNLLYVSEVGYGKLIYFLIEADKSYLGTELGMKNKIGAEADAKAGSKKSSNSLDLSIITGREYQNVKITAFAAGSKAPVANQVQNLDELRAEINSFIKFNNLGAGTPIYYKLKLAKTGQNMNVKFQDKATIRNCKLVSGGFKVEFQNLYAWETTESGNDEVFGIGWADMYVVKRDGSKKYIMPRNRPYTNSRTYKTGQGRILEIDPSSAKSVSSNGILIFPENERSFIVNAREYGYESLDEVLNNTYLRMRFKPKEKDSKNDDEFSTREQTINLGETPKIGERNRDQISKLKISNNKTGVLKYNQHGAIYAVSYTVKPF